MGFFQLRSQCKNKTGKSIKKADDFLRLKPILTGVGVTVPLEETTERFGVALPEQQSVLKLKPKHQQSKVV